MLFLIITSLHEASVTSLSKWPNSNVGQKDHNYRVGQDARDHSDGDNGTHFRTVSFQRLSWCTHTVVHTKSDISTWLIIVCKIVGFEKFRYSNIQKVWGRGGFFFCPFSPYFFLTFSFHFCSSQHPIRLLQPQFQLLQLSFHIHSHCFHLQ